MKWSTGWPGMAQAGLEEAVLDVRHREAGKLAWKLGSWLVEVMDELRRILDRDNCQYIDEVKGRWADFCQKVQFYGVLKKILKPPMGMDKACSGFTLKRKEMEERDETIQGPVRDEREEDADGRAQSGLERRAQKG
ncbi:hypothetical protein AAFF_G00410650 [Aldrovandia affinis]|uniref:Uncharacterized protein n=1 Tax=Aldrovandia affinis TaxID=143900 RepID=A0AAD7VXY5_9TELE|nr:hypothetical protein AAFF_G00410650 [Aldrovandia affinis]